MWGNPHPMNEETDHNIREINMALKECLAGYIGVVNTESTLPLMKLTISDYLARVMPEPEAFEIEVRGDPEHKDRVIADIIIRDPAVIELLRQNEYKDNECGGWPACNTGTALPDKVFKIYAPLDGAEKLEAGPDIC